MNNLKFSYEEKHTNKLFNSSSMLVFSVVFATVLWLAGDLTYLYICDESLDFYGISSIALVVILVGYGVLRLSFIFFLKFTFNELIIKNDYYFLIYTALGLTVMLFLLLK